MVVTVCTRLVSHSILGHIVHSCELFCTMCTMCTYGHNIIKSAHKCMFCFDVHFCAYRIDKSAQKCTLIATFCCHVDFCALGALCALLWKIVCTSVHMAMSRGATCRGRWVFNIRLCHHTSHTALHNTVPTYWKLVPETVHGSAEKSTQQCT